MAPHPPGPTLSPHGPLSPSSGISYVNAPAGTTINFTKVSGPGSLSAPSCATVLATGSCSVTLTSATPGATVDNAHATVTVAGLPFSRGTGEPKAAANANAIK